MDLVIRNASLRGRDDTPDIGVRDGRIEAVEPALDATDAETVDADGGLVLPPFVESHTHLDMAFFEESAPPRVTGTHAECVERALAAMEELSVADVRANARRAVEGFVAHGTTKIRTHVSVAEEWGLDGLEAVLGLREELPEGIDLQVIAYQFRPGFTRERYERMEAAMEMGADIVGGRPNTEHTDERARTYVDAYVDLAQRYDADIDMHVDTTTDSYSRTLEYLADTALEEGYEGRIHAGHLCALPTYDATHRSKVIELASRAGIDVVSNPTEDQLIHDKETTSVRELLDAGINLSVSHNDVADTFYPFGSLDVLEAAWLLIHAVEFNASEEWERVIDFVTGNPARTLGLDGYGLAAGCRADMVVCREGSIRELLRRRSPRRCVVAGGEVVAENSLRRDVRVG